MALHGGPQPRALARTLGGARRGQRGRSGPRWYLPGAGATPHDAAVASAAAARLQRALERLPASGREILLLVAGEGLAVDEAARVLGVSPEAARQRLHRARAALAHDLPKEDER